MVSLLFCWTTLGAISPQLSACFRITSLLMTPSHLAQPPPRYYRLAPLINLLPIKQAAALRDLWALAALSFSLIYKWSLVDQRVLESALIGETQTRLRLAAWSQVSRATASERTKRRGREAIVAARDHVDWGGWLETQLETTSIEEGESGGRGARLEPRSRSPQGAERDLA